MTSLDFAERHPTLLAVGMYDGTIAIYDTAREGEVSAIVYIRSSDASGAGRATVSKVSEEGRRLEFVLLRINDDG